MDLVMIAKIGNGHFVSDHNGNILIGYKVKKNAEDFAYGHAMGIYGEAERYNERRDYAKAYLARRAIRVYSPPSQFELF